jgi:hypothetical protein
MKSTARYSMARKVDGSHELQRLVETNHLTTHKNHPSRTQYQESPKHIKVSEKNAIALTPLTLSIKHPSHHVSERNLIQTSEDKNSSKMTRASRETKRLLCSRYTMFTSNPKDSLSTHETESERKNYKQARGIATMPPQR